MASVPPSNANRETETALVLLLAGTTRRYDLPSMIRQAKVKPRRWAPIRPTNGLKADLAAPYFDIARTWSAQLDMLMAAYERGGTAAIQAQLGLSTSQVQAVVDAARRRFPSIVQRIEAWHRA